MNGRAVSVRGLASGIARFAAWTAVATLAALPAFGGVVYVPVLDPAALPGVTQETRVFLSNTGAAERSASTYFLADNTNGLVRTGGRGKITVPAGRTVPVVGLGQAGTDRLLEIDLHSLVAAEAFVVRSATGASPTLIALPVISSSTALAADSIAYLLGLGRDTATGVASDLGVINLGSATARCEVRFLSAAGVQLAPTASLTFQPLSQRFFRDALGTIGQGQASEARAQVTCNQRFFAFAFLHSTRSPSGIVLEPAATGASTLTVPGDDDDDEPTANSHVTSGLLHLATTANPKGILKVPFDKAVQVGKLTAELEFTPGPWNTSRDPANHNIVWIHLGKYRSKTLCNLNAYAPPRSSIRSFQNVGMPRGQSTDQDKPAQLVQGRTYKLIYVYDAAKGTVDAEILDGGQSVVRLAHAATAPGGKFEIPTTGLVFEFGHLPAPDGPEVPSYGWQYSNLKVTWVPAN